MFESRIYWDSSTGDRPADASAIDVAGAPEVLVDLARLGVERSDLPAVLLEDEAGKLRVVGTALSAAEIAALAQGQGAPASALTLYGASWCGDCRTAKRLLSEAGAAYDEVDIDEDSAAEAAVLTRSGGRRVVPTFVFDGRVWAFNPPPPLLRRLIAGSGLGRAAD